MNLRLGVIVNELQMFLYYDCHVTIGLLNLLIQLAKVEMEHASYLTFFLQIRKPSENCVTSWEEFLSHKMHILLANFYERIFI